jgi:hypothetical protein
MANDVSARDLVKKVWEEVAAEQALGRPPAADLADYGRLVEDPERHYVNSRYVLDRTPLDFEPGGDGRRPVGRVTSRLRARAARFVVGALGGYLDDEREFLGHLVRLQNAITVHIDRLSAEVRQLQASLQIESERLRAAEMTLHARLEDRIKALEDELAGLRRQGGGER